MTVKRLIALLSGALLLLNLCACAESKPPAATAVPTAEPTETVLTPTPETPAPTSAATAAPTTEPTPAPTAEPTAEPDNAETLEVLRGGQAMTYSAAMTELTLHSGVTCAVLLPTEVMTAEFTENAWRLTETDNGEKGFLELSYIAGTTAETLLPGLMDGYLEFADIEFADVSSIGAVRGTVAHVSASDGEWLAEGWILDADGGAISIVKACTLNEVENLGNLLAAVLDSFTIVNG